MQQFCGRFMMLFLISSLLLHSCSRTIDLNTNNNGGNGSTNNGYSDPTKPTYTPPSNTGDTTKTDNSGNGSGNEKITATSLTPCASSSESVSLQYNGTNFPTGAIFEWYFGDGESKKVSTPTVVHIYKKPGTFPIVAKVDSAGTYISTANKTLVLLGTSGAPVVSFTSQLLSNVNAGINYAFNSTSTIATGSIKTYSWDFGDSRTLITNNTYVTHMFDATNTAQTYVVSLTVTSANGCTSTKAQTITVPASSTNNIPLISGDISFTKTNPCIQNSEIFTFLSNTKTPSSSVFFWDFGDGYSGGGNPVQHTYATPGTYEVRLTAGNLGPQTFTANFTSKLSVIAFGQNVIPTAIIQIVPEGNKGNSFLFTSNSTVPTGIVLGTNWDFGDNTYNSSPSFSKTYQQTNSTQNFNVKLTAVSNSGCSSTTVQRVTVPPL